MSTLTNQRPCLADLTNQMRVMHEVSTLTNQRPCVEDLTNKRRVMYEASALTNQRPCLADLTNQMQVMHEVSTLTSLGRPGRLCLPSWKQPRMVAEWEMAQASLSLIII